jgi:hypothetical protein
MRSSSVFSLFIGLMASNLGFSAGADLVRDGLLSQASLDSLIAADRSEGYSVKILVKNFDGRRLVVPVLGEMHIKDEADSLLGKNVLSHFNFRALESLMDGAPPSCLTRAVGRLAELGMACYEYMNPSATFQSTILDAFQERPWFDEQRSKHILGLKNWVLKPLPPSAGPLLAGKKLNELTSEQRRSVSIQWAIVNARGESQVVSYTLEVIYQHQDQILAGDVRHFLPLDPAQKYHFWLEKDHVRGVGEAIAVAYPAVRFTLCLAAACTFLPYSETIFSPEISSGLRIAAATSLVTNAVASYWDNIHEQREKLPIYINPMNGLIFDRDSTMARNLNQITIEYPELNSLLAIVGKAHVPGLVKLLTTNYGFELESLE